MKTQFDQILPRLWPIWPDFTYPLNWLLDPSPELENWLLMMNYWHSDMIVNDNDHVRIQSNFTLTIHDSLNSLLTGIFWLRIKCLDLTVWSLYFLFTAQNTVWNFSMAALHWWLCCVSLADWGRCTNSARDGQKSKCRLILIRIDVSIKRELQCRERVLPRNKLVIVIAGSASK